MGRILVVGLLLFVCLAARLTWKRLDRKAELDALPYIPSIAEVSGYARSALSAKVTVKLPDGQNSSTVYNAKPGEPLPYAKIGQQIHVYVNPLHPTTFSFRREWAVNNANALVGALAVLGFGTLAVGLGALTWL